MGHTYVCRVEIEFWIQCVVQKLAQWHSLTSVWISATHQWHEMCCFLAAFALFFFGLCIELQTHACFNKRISSREWCKERTTNFSLVDEIFSFESDGKFSVNLNSLQFSKFWWLSINISRFWLWIKFDPRFAV